MDGADIIFYLAQLSGAYFGGWCSGYLLLFLKKVSEQV
jgi:hypothetical protein